MAQAFDDLTGKTFGRLLVLEFDHFDKHHVSYYKVQCECGSPVKVVQRCNLISKSTISCNCWRLEQSAARSGENSPVYKHGQATHENEKSYGAFKWQRTLAQRRDAALKNRSAA